MSWTEPRTWIIGEKLTKADLDAQVRDNLNYLKTNLALEAAAELTIAAGVITKTRAHHTVDTESDAVTDDLVTIEGGSEGELLLIRPASASRTVVIKHNTGNIWNPSFNDQYLIDSDSYLLLAYSGSKWCIIGAGGGVPSNYASNQYKIVSVKSDETGLEFIFNLLTGLHDGPGTYVGSGSKYVRIKSTADGFEFIQPTFLELDDVPATYFGASGQAVLVSEDETQLEFGSVTAVERVAVEPALELSKLYHNTVSHKLFYCKEDV